MPGRKRFALLLVTACAAGGCGGSDEPERPGLTHAQYVAEVNALCREAAKDAPPFPGKKSGSGYVTRANLVIPYLETSQDRTATELQGLRTLAPSEADQAEAKALIAALAARLKDLKAALAAARKGDGKAFTAAIQKDQGTDRPTYVRAASRLGAKACARSG